MKSLIDQLKINFAKRDLGKAGIGAYCIHLINSHFQEKYEITGYIRHSKIYIKIQPNFAKTQVFMQKSILLKKLNEGLEKLGYKQKIEDIVMK